MSGTYDTPRKRVRGFTLIEIMVAVAVVAIVFVSFYKLFSQSITADSTTRFYTIAPLLAQQKMTEIKDGITVTDYGGAGTFEKYPGYTWQVQILDLTSESLGKAVSDLKQVDITISGRDDSGKFSLRAYVYPRK